MSELKHWLDEASEADELERSILRAGLGADPPEAKQAQVWSNLMGALAIAPVVAATTGAQAVRAKAAAVGVSKVSAVWLAIGKGFVVGLAVYGAAAGVSEVSSRFNAPHTPVPSTQQPPPPTRAPTSKAESPPASTASPLALETEDLPAAPRANPRGSAAAVPRAPLNRPAALPTAASFVEPAPPSSTRASQLEAETRALRRARAELRLGKLADAFATLEASRRNVSAPELYQEHEALMIELLYRSGQASAARERASAFLERFPESPHAQQIRQFAGE